MKSFNSVILLITDKCPHQQNSKLLSCVFLLAPFWNPFTSLRGCASESIKTRWQQLLETLTCILHPALESTKMLTAWQPDGETCTGGKLFARSDISEGTGLLSAERRGGTYGIRHKVSPACRARSPSRWVGFRCPR